MNGNSKVRSIRIDEQLDANLTEAAEENGHSVSSFIGRVLEDYMKFTRLAEKINYVSLPEHILKELVENLTVEECRQWGLTMAPT